MLSEVLEQKMKEKRRRRMAQQLSSVDLARRGVWTREGKDPFFPLEEEKQEEEVRLRVQ